MNNASCADLVGAMQSAAAVMSPMKKRASTVELNGECYLAIEPEARDARTARDPLEPCVYRGGAGTVPRNRYGYDTHCIFAFFITNNICPTEFLSQLN